MSQLRDTVDSQGPLGRVGAETLALLLAWNGASWDRLRAGADSGDAIAVSALGILRTLSGKAAFNGATWDRWRNNINVTVLASAVRAATNQSTDQVNYNARGLHVVFDITVAPGVDSVTATIQGKDPVSDKYYTVLAGAAQTAVGTVVMRVYPGLAAAANLVANDVLPRTWRVNVAHSGAGNFTYSVGASLIL